MRYLSLFSGIEAATQAWAPLGWEAAAFAEIEPFPAAVLAHHYPNVPNLGDVTKFMEWPDIGSVDVVCGGSPCQSFSVAGLRQGMADPRGNLMLTYLAIVARYRPKWVVYENVPGLLSSNDGRDFGTLLRALAELGYGFAYRVLDAQHVRTRRFPFAVPQRRRRVWVVGYLGDWRRAAAVLFDRESMSGHPAPRREAGQVSPTIPARSLGGGGLGTDFDCDGGLICSNSGELVPITLMQRGRDDGPSIEWRQDGTANALLTPNGGRAGMGVGCVAAPVALHDVLTWAVRRLTPRECERLQGFPEDFTCIPWRKKPADQCPDGPRYKALGNSWAVNCAEWIGERIQMVEDCMKHDLSRQHRNQRERRSRKQEDYVTTGILRGMGAGEIEDWQDDLEGWRDEIGEDGDR